MIDHNGAWLPSVWLGVPALALAFLLCLAAIFLLARHSEDRTDFWIMAWLPLIGAIAFAVIPMLAYWPWSGDYHRLQPATGTVAAVDTRFLAASQYVVVTYDTGLIVRCDDSRCATVEPGEKLRLLCTKEFEWGAVNGWGCKWGQE